MGSSDFILFGGLILAAYSAYLLVSFFLASSGEKQQLSWANNSEPVKSKSPIINSSRPLIHQFTLQYALKIRNDSYRKSVRRAILTSGLSREINEDEFIGLQILWGLGFPILFLFLNFTMEFGLNPVLCFLAAPLGVYYPFIHANAEKKNREVSVRADMPFFVDLLSLSVEAGLDFFSAMQKIVDKSRDAKGEVASVLAQEFATVLSEVRMGSSKSQALRALADRLDMTEVTSFCAVLIDAEATGASIANVLKDQSVQMRLERFVRAEKAGARASQLILMPIMLFILPAVLIAVFGPIAINMMNGGGQ
jgi:tight adherence protein C